MESKLTNNSDNMTLEDLLSFSNFQKLYAEDYGYGGTIHDMRKREFSRIGGKISHM